MKSLRRFNAALECFAGDFKANSFFLSIFAIFGQMVVISLKFDSFEQYKSHFVAF